VGEGSTTNDTENGKGMDVESISATYEKPRMSKRGSHQLKGEVPQPSRRAIKVRAKIVTKGCSGGQLTKGDRQGTKYEPGEGKFEGGKLTLKEKRQHPPIGGLIKKESSQITG